MTTLNGWWAFFTAHDDTHRRTLSQFHEHVRRSRVYRARKPRLPFYTLYDTARYVDRTNTYETAHEMVVNYQAAIPTSTAGPPSTPINIQRVAARFEENHPELRDVGLSPDVKAFLELSQLDPDRVLHSRSLGRFGGGERVFLRNSLEAVEQRALDFTQRRPEFEQVTRAIAEVSGQEEDE